MGLKIKSQIIWILFSPMALVVLIMCYFNISIIESTLISNTIQSTKTSANYIREKAESILFPDPSRATAASIQPRAAESIYQFLRGIPEVRSYRIFDMKGEPLFAYGADDEESPQKHEMLAESIKTTQVLSSLWAYKNEEDRKGIPLSRPDFLDRRLMSYEYFLPVACGKFAGIFYISFSVNRLPTLLKLITMANLSLALIFLISTFIAISIWSDNAIKRPLSFILQAQDRLARGDFDTRVNLDFAHTNELARAYGSFNKMAEDLKSFREELEKKNIRLSELNEQYRQLNERLEVEVQEKTQELREFFSLITHDLKVPLAASQGYTALLLKPKTGPLNEKQQKFLQSISMANTHLLHLVRNMLDSVKYEAGKINYFFEPFDLAILLDEVRSNLHLFLEEKQIELTVIIPDECRSVFADRMKIGQVLTNLINNAITVSKPRDTITLTTLEINMNVEIRIIDQGPGIEIEKQGSIFDKFTQFHDGVKPSGGMGLGLYIVRKILEGHGQAIRVESVAENGSTFIFSLPRKGPGSESDEVKDSL